MIVLKVISGYLLHKITITYHSLIKKSFKPGEVNRQTRKDEALILLENGYLSKRKKKNYCTKINLNAAYVFIIIE